MNNPKPQTPQDKIEIKYLDELIIRALESRKKVTLFLCRDEEGGFGIKINGKVISRNNAWEVFEEEIEKL